MLQLAESMKQDGADGRLVEDVRMSSVALAVGALDAYFCDAYVDCLTAVLKAYTRGLWQGALPSAYFNQQLPAGVVLDSSRENHSLWALRMAARKIMERDNMLSIRELKNYFNGILPASHKLWAGLIDSLIAYNLKDLTKFTKPDTDKLSGKDLEKAKKAATETFQIRLSETVQYRHDWAHNCGRPRQAIKAIPHGQAKKRIREIRAFVEAFDDHIESYRLA